MAKSPAMKSYNRRMVWLSAGYAIFLIAAVYSFKHDFVHEPIAYVVAILPALPIIGIFAAMGRYLVEETDEYLRMLMIRQSLWASGFCLSLATIWGFLESFDLAGHVDAYWLAVAWFFGLGIGGLANKIQFGSTGSGC